MAQFDSDKLATAMAGGGLGFGVAAFLAPGVFAKVYGLPATPHIRALLRAWGTRTMALGAIYMGADVSGRKKVIQAVTALCTLDTIATVATRGDVLPRTRWLTAASNATFAAAGALVISGVLDS